MCWVIQGTTTGVMKGDTRSLDEGSFGDVKAMVRFSGLGCRV